MKSGKKSAIGKTMRVATTFTGAAACAAAFAPAATAATHTAAEYPYHKFPTNETLALRGEVTPATTGSIRSASCTGRSEWLHVYWYSTEGAGPFLTCVGYKGKLTGLTMDMVAQCGGTNHGKFFPGSLTYVAGTTYRYFTSPLRSVSAISIAGWTGTDKC